MFASSAPIPPDRARDANVTLTMAIDPRLPAVEADTVRLRQVLLNLLSNAINYGLQNPISIEASVENGQAVIRVQDQGIGISPEDHGRRGLRSLRFY